MQYKSMNEAQVDGMGSQKHLWRVLPDCCIATLKIIPQLARKPGCKWIWLLIRCPKLTDSSACPAGIWPRDNQLPSPSGGSSGRCEGQYLEPLNCETIAKQSKKKKTKKNTEKKSRECLLLAAGHLSASQKEWLKTIMNPIKQKPIYGGFRDKESTGKLS